MPGRKELPMTEHRVEKRGDVWTVEPPERDGKPCYWTTYQEAKKHADDLNRTEAITAAIRRRLGGQHFTVSRECQGGNLVAWAIDLNHFDTVDGPRLLLTDYTDHYYVLGIYDTRQEVPGGPEPIIETSRFRVENETWQEAHARVRQATGNESGRAVAIDRNMAARPDQIAEWVAHRALFVLNLATAEAKEIIDRTKEEA
jgi:hypothetical protein